MSATWLLGPPCHVQKFETGLGTNPSRRCIEGVLSGLRIHGHKSTRACRAAKSKRYPSCYAARQSPRTRLTYSPISWPSHNQSDTKAYQPSCLRRTQLLFSRRRLALSKPWKSISTRNWAHSKEAVLRKTSYLSRAYYFATRKVTVTRQRSCDSCLQNWLQAGH